MRGEHDQVGLDFARQFADLAVGPALPNLQGCARQFLIEGQHLQVAVEMFPDLFFRSNHGRGDRMRDRVANVMHVDQVNAGLCSLGDKFRPLDREERGGREIDRDENRFDVQPGARLAFCGRTGCGLARPALAELPVLAAGRRRSADFVFMIPASSLFIRIFLPNNQDRTRARGHHGLRHGTENGFSQTASSMRAKTNHIGIETFRLLPDREARIAAFDNLRLDPETILRFRRDEPAQLQAQFRTLLPRLVFLRRVRGRLHDVENP